MTIYAGIDYSLTSPGVVIWDSEKSKNALNPNNCVFHFMTNVTRLDKFNYNNQIFGTYIKQDYKNPNERYEQISQWALNLVQSADVITMEGYSFASKGLVFHIAENTGILKYVLWKAGKNPNIISPGTVKKIATGKGRGDKDVMYSAFTELLAKENLTDSFPDFKTLFKQSRSSSSPSSDLIDAYYLMTYGITSKL